MVYLLTAGCMILAACGCVVSYIVVNKRIGTPEPELDESNEAGSADSVIPDSDEESESGLAEPKKCEKTKLKDQIKTAFSVSPISRWIVFAVSVVLVGFVCLCAQTIKWGGYGIDAIGFGKIATASILLMSAAVIDFYTKKIPNFLPILFLIFGTVFLIIELFINKQSILLFLLSSIFGLVGSFLILLLMSLITKGGIGMGDVKLISTLGFLMGITATFYSFAFSIVLCLIVTIILLISKMKKMKDNLPFGPFLFLGFIIAIILGKF